MSDITSASELPAQQGIVRVVCYLPQWLFDILEAEARRGTGGISRSEVIRRALERAYQARKPVA